MSWVYQQISGKLYAPDGKHLATGYSGHGDAMNDSSREQEKCIGPIPRGSYRIGAAFDSDRHGKHCMHLTPEPGTDTFGRDGFLIHGDSIPRPGTASEGCIVQPKFARERITDSGDNLLQVI